MNNDDATPDKKELLNQEFKLLINGELTSGESKEFMETVDPSNGEIIAKIPNASIIDVNNTIVAAKKAQKEWALTSLEERQNSVLEIAKLLKKYSNELGLLDTLDTGNLYSTMRYDADWAAGIIQYMCSSANEVKGEVTHHDNNLHYTKRYPFGVTAKLLPFNHPIQAFGTGLAAPLLMGNSLILKPSPHTPLSALYFGKIIKDILPPGVINILTGTNERVSMPIVQHPDVPRLALTGSIEAGKKVSLLASENLKKVSLELGGKNPLIIFEDADPELAAQIAIKGMNFSCQSQSCSAPSKVFVHKSIKKEFIEKLCEKVKVLRPGLPTDPSSDIGSLSTKNQFNKVLEYIKSGQADGANLLMGGKIPNSPNLKNGFFITPAIFSDAKPNMRISKEEIYGPIITILDWDNYEEMISIANDTKYGLAAVIVTNSLNSAHKVANDLNVGYIEINAPVSFSAGSPYGGWKQSGDGREGSIDELLSYTQIKSINLNIFR